MSNAAAITNNANLAQLMLDAAGYRKSQIVIAGLKFDVFSAIEGLPTPRVEDLASTLKLHPRSIEKLLSGLIAMDLVTLDAGVYRNTPTTKVYLLPSSPTYVGYAITSLYEIGVDTWGHLTNIVEKGHPTAKQRTDEPEAKFWQNLTKAIRPFSLQVAETTAKLMADRQGSLRKVLDIGGGSGVFSGAFLSQFPEAKAYQVDWPAINSEARKFNQRFVDEKRFITLDSDFYADEVWGAHGPYDVAVISHIIHQESPERIVGLLKKVIKNLNPDGSIVINEYYLNKQKNFPPYSLIFDLSMLLQNEGGAAYSFSDVEKFLAEVDHEIAIVSSPVPPSSVVISAPRQRRLQLVSSRGSAVLENTSAASPDASAAKTSMPASFSDRRWDYTPYRQLQQLVASRLSEQLQFAAKHSTFWRRALAGNPLLAKPELSLEEFQQLPLLTKNVLRLAPTQDLVCNPEKPFYMVRASSGTTGAPVSIYWSKGDLQAAVETSARFLAPFGNWQGLRVWNGYHQGHIAGPAFDDILRHLGATPIPRHFHASDRDAIADMARHQIKALVIPPNAGSGKGGSLEDLLAVAPDFISRLGIHTILASSTDFSSEMITEVRELGVKNIINFYGTTEAMPTAISCAEDPRTFHLCQGHIYLEVLDAQGKHVKNGERGQIAVSRIGSRSAEGIGPVEGTQLFRYLVGDSALYHTVTCVCGITTPRISQLMRNANSEEKFSGGCEKWE